MPRHLLSIDDLGPAGIAELLRVSEAFAEVERRPMPKVPTLRGRVVATLFFEESTRTRLSFETAAKRLSADVLSFSAASSSLKKGESLRDTVETVEAMGIDALVVRHPSSGATHQVARWARRARVINAGDGWHEHPTQALLDCFTVRQVLAERAGADPGDFGVRCFEGLRVLIVGDVRHSRVARSQVLAYSVLGARVTLAAPGSLLPPSLEGWPVSVAHDLDRALGDADVVSLLRLQAERGSGAFVPSLREYTAHWGLTARACARHLSELAIVTHPGPMVRGVEIASDVVDLPNLVVTRQVTNGVAVRMAVLFLLLGSEGPADPSPPEGSPPGSQPWLRRSPSQAPLRRSPSQARLRRSPSQAPLRRSPSQAPLPRSLWGRSVAERRVVVRGGTLVDQRGMRTADVLVAGSTIEAVGPDLPVPPGTLVLDAGGCLVGPGLVDLHTHLRQPGREEAETVETGARAAALGGYTAVVAMPNTEPAIDNAGTAREVLELGRSATTEVAVAGAITVGRRGERLAPMAELAALGVRLFTDDGTGVQDGGLMRRALDYARGLGVTLAQHCEDENLAAGGAMHEGAWSSRLGLPGVPAAAEEAMVARDLALVRLTRAPMHFLHLSTAGIARAAPRGQSGGSGGHRRGRPPPFLPDRCRGRQRSTPSSR